MIFIHKAKLIALHSKSVIAMVLLATLGVAGPDAAFLILGRDTNPVAWTLAILAIALWGILGRLQYEAIQDGMARRRWPRTVLRYALWLGLVLGAVLWSSRVYAQAATEEATLAVAVPFIAEWEGVRLASYIPVPGDRPTICFGATFIDGHPVQMGMRMTHAQCLALLWHDVKAYRDGMHRYWTADTIAHRLPAARDAAFTSFPFNVGIGAAGGSTAAKRLNAGNVTGACEALGWWNKAGGRVLRGLVNRRAAETQLCMAGL